MCESVSLCVCVWQPEVEPHVINVTDRREHVYTDMRHKNACILNCLIIGDTLSKRFLLALGQKKSL